MTPKEQAQILFDKFWPLCKANDEGLVRPVAIQCALICVDVIISDYESSIDYLPLSESRIVMETHPRYWKKVKEELLKLKP